MHNKQMLGKIGLFNCILTHFMVCNLGLFVPMHFEIALRAHFFDAALKFGQNKNLRRSTIIPT